MSLATLDTQEAIKNLRSAGFTDAVARNTCKRQDPDISTRSTKVDVEKMRTGLSAEITQVRTDLSTEIGKLRADLTNELEKALAEISELKADGCRCDWLPDTRHRRRRLRPGQIPEALSDST